jgi:hypothetical protein
VLRKQERKWSYSTLEQDDPVEYIDWLRGERQLKAGMVNSYMSGFRQIHYTY